MLKAKDAQGALTIIESGMPIDLLFTDVVMPGSLKSTDLARKARERMPNLAVLFTSGYAEDAVVHSGRLDESVELLSKPYSREALARKIRHVLANAAQRKLALAAAVDQGAAPANPLPRRSFRVLVCDDDALIRESTIEMLRSIGHHARGAGNARTALSILTSERVDILLTDIGLPDMSGTMLAEYAATRAPQLAVVLVTGQAPDPAERGGMRVPILMKPFSLDVLLGVIGLVEGVEH